MRITGFASATRVNERIERGHAFLHGRQPLAGLTAIGVDATGSRLEWNEIGTKSVDGTNAV